MKYILIFKNTFWVLNTVLIKLNYNCCYLAQETYIIVITSLVITHYDDFSLTIN